MSFIWNAKNNFILSHFVVLHRQQQLLNTNIDWSSIMNDISCEISSTPYLLKDQYEVLVKSFHEKNESQLHSVLKRIYLHSLCQQIEDDSNALLAIAYELIRHVRATRILAEDIEQLLKEWNFNCASDDEKKNKDRLFDILNRLLYYIHILPNRDYRSANSNEKSIVCRKEIQHEYLKLVSDSDEKISVAHTFTNKRKKSINIDTAWKSSKIRRRTKSLTLFDGNTDNHVNAKIELFVPKLKRQQRSSSLHEQSSMSMNSLPLKDKNLQRQWLLTAVVNDHVSDSIGNSNLRRTHVQPSISWLPLTNDQIMEKEHKREQSTLICDEQYTTLDQISSSDSESIKIKQSTDRHN